MKILIEMTQDTYHCEDCVTSWADGGRIYFDGELKFEFIPQAHCYDNDTMGESDLYKKAFELLGHELYIC